MSKVFIRVLVLSLIYKNGFGSPRVNKGKEIEIEDAPYMAWIQVTLDAAAGLGLACDGTILSDSYILTAGHCATDESNINVPNPPLHDPSAFMLLIGTSDISSSEGGEAFTVSKVFLREYSSKNDLAILKLSTKILLDGVTKSATRLPSSPSYTPDNRTQAYVDGWGTNPQNTNKLLRADIYTISVEECNTGADKGRDRTYQICTLGDDGAGPCQGDSGGPMLRTDDGVQIGVVSFVPLNCDHPGKTTSTFTAVAPNLKWIRGIMNGDDESNQQTESGASSGSHHETQTTTSNPLNLFGFPFGELLSNLTKGSI